MVRDSFKYTQKVLRTNNSIVKIIGRVTLLIQLQPRLQEVEQKVVITADKGVECLLGIDFLKTNKCFLSLQEEKLYSIHFKVQYRLPQRKCRAFDFLQLWEKLHVFK